MRFIYSTSIALALHVVSIVHCQAREQIEVVESAQGADLTEFLKVVGSKLRAYTDMTGHEACAAIGVGVGGTYSVQVFTDGVSIGCTINPRDVQPGAQFTGEIIHSHPTLKVLSIGAAERAWALHSRSPHVGSTTLRNDGSSGFSRVDYSYPGISWLVAGRNLLRKDASGKTRKMGEIQR